MGAVVLALSFYICAAGFAFFNLPLWDRSQHVELCLGVAFLLTLGILHSGAKRRGLIR